MTKPPEINPPREGEHCVMLLKGVNHIGVTVTDLRATVAWYREMFEAEPTFTMQGLSGMDDQLQVEGAEVDLAFFLLGNTCVEFLQYRKPDGRAFDLRNCDVGAVHICFEVQDLAATHERLQAKGVQFNAPPLLIEQDVPFKGITVAYFRDLEGIQLEMFQLPAGSVAQAPAVN
jgi:catechol 2,3-dioxygenase-like lactoylglutathione lyase family enzyme